MEMKTSEPKGIKTGNAVVIMVFLVCFYAFPGLVSAFQPAARHHQQQKTLEERFSLARELAYQNRLDEAREICLDILQEKSDYHDARVLLGKIYARSSQLEFSSRELQTALRAQPRRRDALTALADVEFRRGDFEQALRVLERALTFYPEDKEFWLKKAQVLLAMEEYRRADRELDKLLNIYPHFKKAHELQDQVALILRKYKITLGYRGDFFQRAGMGYGPWQLGSLEVLRRFPAGSLLGRVLYARSVFADPQIRTGFQAEIEAYPEISSRLYAHLNAGYSSSDIFPDRRLGGEIYAVLPAGFEVSGGARHIQLPSSGVMLYTGTLGKYFKNNLLSFRPFVSRENSELSYSGLLLFRHYLRGDKEYFGLLLGGGPVPVDLIFFRDFERNNAYKMGLEFQKRLFGSWVVNVHGRYEKEEHKVDSFGDRFILRLGLQKFF